MGPPHMPDPSPSTLSPGTRFGTYEILEQLGAGGMGEVYRARDTRLGREVAIKTVSLHDRRSQAEALTRFETEARSASALNHPNIVTIYELGCVDSTHFIAMELVRGETVRQLLASGPIPFRKAMTIAAQVADALARAHEIGVVHRDLKPDNLMVSVDGAAKVQVLGFPPKVTAPEMELKKDMKELVFKVSTDKGSPAGTHRNIFCQATIIEHGEPIVHYVGGTELRIDQPLPAPTKPAAPAAVVKKEAPKPAAAPKRLTRLEQLRLDAKEKTQAAAGK